MRKKNTYWRICTHPGSSVDRIGLYASDDPSWGLQAHDPGSPFYTLDKFFDHHSTGGTDLYRGKGSIRAAMKRRRSYENLDLYFLWDFFLPPGLCLLEILPAQPFCRRIYACGKEHWAYPWIPDLLRRIVQRFYLYGHARFFSKSWYRCMDLPGLFGWGDGILPFFGLGYLLRKKAKEHNFQGVAGLMVSSYGTRWAGVAMFASAFVFLIPYVAIQIRGISIFLEAAFPGMLPSWAWALIMVVMMLVYAEIGGTESHCIQRCHSGTHLADGDLAHRRHLHCRLWKCPRPV